VDDCFGCPVVLLCRHERRQRVLPPQQWLWLWLRAVVRRSGSFVLCAGPELLRSGPDVLRSGSCGGCSQLLRSGSGCGSFVLRSGCCCPVLLRSGS